MQAIVQTVSFESQGQRLVGRLHLPAGVDSPPLVIVTGSWTTVKEQMPARYAELLAARGYAALRFDFRGFGESAGEPRDVESASAKAADFCAAVSFSTEFAGVDGKRIGLLPICASAGYAVAAARREPRIRSVAMVAPWLHDRAIVESFYGGADGVSARLERARKARESYETTGRVDYVQAASNSDPTAAMYWEGDALDYYLNPARGAVPQWGNRFALMAWKEWLEFDPIALAPQYTVPTRLVSGEETATPGGAKAFAARTAAPNDLVLLRGTQFDFYDDPATVSAATDAAVEHFRRTL